MRLGPRRDMADDRYGNCALALIGATKLTVITIRDGTIVYLFVAL